MQDAVPAGVGAMAAIMGLSPAVVADACKRAAEGEILFGGKSEFAGPDGDFRARRCGKASRGIGLSGGSEARRGSGGFRAVSFGADDAGAGRSWKKT